ncbi:unnamed protein product [Cylindrotheca closterium]|uniref:Uncharacterized protein n=1 Tax=Cylindrotheca closterium TaxID=2856 RepID=A0AAD2GE04_9STRA|nr:unnamed protein product [Cylindrotheca closterium]
MSMHSFKTSSAHKRSMETSMEPAETDESESLHFQTPTKDETAPIMRKERKVCFNSRVRCRRSIAPITNPDNLWYSKQDLANLRKQDKRLQNLAMAGVTSFVGDDDTEEISYVGLYSAKERRQRIKRIKESKTCVLSEQLQQEEKFYNEIYDLSDFNLNQESIAEYFSVFSIRAARVAHMKGLQVSRHVENLSAEESTDSDDSQPSCSQHSRPQRSKAISGHCPVRNSSIQSAGSLIARLTTAA